MDREIRLRRCLLICCQFARNLAYHRARHSANQLIDGEFWISVDANFIDIAVLEWCKVLGDYRAQHEFNNIFQNPQFFLCNLLEYININNEDWIAYVSKVRRYRDKFLAHLDSDGEMCIPELETALKAAQFYYDWIVCNEFNQFDLKNLPATLTGYYSDRFVEARQVYAASI